MLATFALAAIVAAVPQQTAQEILATAAAKQMDRMATVRNYTIIMKVDGGAEAPLFYEGFVDSAAGGVPAYRLVPISEWTKRDPRNAGNDIDLQQAAAQVGPLVPMIGGAMKQAIAGVPGGGMASAKIDEAVATFPGFLAQAASYRESDGRQEATDQAMGVAAFAQRARLVGTNTVFGGRPAFHLVADSLSDLTSNQVGEAEFVVDKISLWIDTEEFVQLQLRVFGTMKNKDQSMPIKIELNQWNYAQVGPMYEPRSQLMGITGLMGGSQLDPKQQREMAKARADMEKLKQQIAAMPASQRAMIQGQVDKAERQLALMTDQDVISSEVQLMVYSINKGPPFYWKPTCPSLEGPGAGAAPEFCTQ
jgi:hypothetical protein